MDDNGKTEYGQSHFCRPGKARDIFTAADNVLPMPFKGGLVNMLFGETSTWPTASLRPQQCISKRTSTRKWWPIVSVFTLTAGGLKSSGLWVSVANNIDIMPYGCVSAMVNMNPLTGKWSFETAGTFREDRLDVSASGQLCAWRYPTTFRLDVDYKFPMTTVSLYVDPVLKKYSVQCLQAISNRISMGCEMNYFEKKCDDYYQNKWSSVQNMASVSLLAKYAGPNYLVSGMLNPITRAAKVAYYHHSNDWLQAAAIFDVDTIQSITTSRLAFRVLSDTSVFRAAIHTDGVFNVMLDKKFNKHVSVSGSVLLNAINRDNFRIGIGLSFE